jgi:hypothetical protein
MSHVIFILIADRTPEGAMRGLEYDSLFSVRQREVRTCDQCHDTPSNRVEDLAQGLIVHPRSDIKNDTVEDALARSMAESPESPESSEDKCKVCEGSKGNLNITRTIIAAPEYLRIYLNPHVTVKRYETDEEGNQVPVTTAFKNTRHIEIPDVLDITEHMDYLATVEDPSPVRYKLVSATYHQGRQLNAGHYTAAVTGPQLPFGRRRPQFFCNDATITNLAPTANRPNAITRNPMMRSFDAVALYYERITPTRDPVDPVKRRKTADQIVIDEGKAREKVADGSGEGA